MNARRSARLSSLFSIALLLGSASALADGPEQEGGGGPRARGVPYAPSKPWPACVTPEDFEPTSPLPLWDFRSLYVNPMFKLAGYKDPDGVDNYLRCWKESDAFHRLYVEKYRKLIQAAADAAGVPFQILACLFFYESKFDKDIVSPRGARGLSQVMPGTWKSVTGNLDKKGAVTNPYILTNLKKHIPQKGGTAIAAVVGRLQTFFDKLEPDPKKREANRKKNLNPPITGKQNLETLRSILRDLERYESYADNANVAQYLSNTNSAMERIQSREIYDAYLKRLGKSSIAMDPFSPEAAIIVGALVLKVDVYQGIFGHAYTYPSHDRWIIAAGGYNTGAGGIKCGPEATAEECIRITTIPETKKHMRGIKNCSEHENWKNKENKAHPKGCVG